MLVFLESLCWWNGTACRGGGSAYVLQRASVSDEGQDILLAVSRFRERNWLCIRETQLSQTLRRRKKRHGRGDKED